MSVAALSLLSQRNLSKLSNCDKYFRRSRTGFLLSFFKFSPRYRHKVNMVQEEKVQGWEAFQEFVSTLKGSEILNIYFTGSKDSDGKSWCPDCVSAEPHVRNGLKHAPEGSIFLQVEVGERSYWKDTKNPFRTDKSTKLSVIPTLMRWKSHQKLEGAHCESEDLVEMFFSDV